MHNDWEKIFEEYFSKIIHTTIYLPNKLPTRSVQGMIPMEVWFCSKLSAKHLKVLDSTCYIHAHAVKKGKLNDKAKIDIFLGYAAQLKGYRVYKVEASRVVVYRDMKIDDDVYWNREID